MAELTQWSLARWGQELTDRYLDDLHQGMEWIAKNRKSITARGELTADTGLCIYPVREHYAVFLPVAKRHIVIVAFLRQGRDVASILSKNNAKISHELKTIVKKIEQGKLAIPVAKK